MPLENLELACDICFKLSWLNNTQGLLYDFWRFAIQCYEGFLYEYKRNCYSRKQREGFNEKHLCLFLMKMCCVKCISQNDQISSAIMTLLGYKSYHETAKWFRQKTENCLRKERKEGGNDPPSSRSLLLYSFLPFNSMNPSSWPAMKPAFWMINNKRNWLITPLACIWKNLCIAWGKRKELIPILLYRRVLVVTSQSGNKGNAASAIMVVTVWFVEINLVIS